MNRRSAIGLSLAVALLAGCATPSSQPGPTQDASSNWTGRLSLRIDSAPVQSFAALFDLRGNPDAGELMLTTPIGSTLAQLKWSPGEALLKNGGETRRYVSLAALAEAATGAAIPIEALFAWLEGREQVVPGWRVDLGAVPAGRLNAQRESPLPTADLRIIFARG